MQEFKEYIKNKRNLINLIILIVIILAIPLGIYLAKNTQIFSPKADRGSPITLLDGDCVITKNSKKAAKCREISVSIISPLGPPVGSGDPSATPSASVSASPSASQSASPSPSPKSFSRIFLTSGTYIGSLGGLSGADSKCQSLANQANLNGTFKAWLSDSRTSARDRLPHSDKPYKRIDGKTIANNWSGLIDSKLDVEISVDENSIAVPETEVWTNTDKYGSLKKADKSCQNWNSNSSEDSGEHGNSSKRDGNWTEDDDERCNIKAALYCVEII